MFKKLNRSLSVLSSGCVVVFSCSVLSVLSHADDGLTEALSGGEAYGNLRLRFESVEQNNTTRDAEALTLRTMLGFKTAEVNGFSGVVEFEDVRIIGGIDNYSGPGGAGFQSGQYSVIADEETTELDQGFIQYKNGSFKGKWGAQVITLDGHRFVGHVGWRQDRQTFDALLLNLKPSNELTITLGHIYGRNRILAERADQDAKDNIIHAAYKFASGTLTGYAYLLEDDFGLNAKRDTVGLSFKGNSKIGDSKLHYTLEFASQSFEDDSSADFTAEYLLAELGTTISGITGKVGYEVLGSDDGAFGFGTPLATLHKFNGWSDQFLSTPDEGIEDIYALVGSKIGPGKLTVIYHDFRVDEKSAGSKQDLGFEWNAVYAVKFGKGYNAGVKFADYNAQGHNVDAKKLWLWVGKKI